MMAGVPGGFNKNLPKNYYFSVERTFWTHHKHLKDGRDYHCHGKVVHDVCIITAPDLSSVVKSKNSLFFNKYFMDLDHTVMGCMEERIVASNKLEYQTECLDE